MRFQSLMALSALSAKAMAQVDYIDHPPFSFPDYCAPHEHRVDLNEMPYVQEGVHPCQYAGHYNVSESVNGTADHNLFYWYFRHEDKSKPVVLWLNGGPGATSMFGLFLENGPLRAEQNGDDFKITPAAQSWADEYHVLFVDQPIGTGFSYGAPILTSMDDGALEFADFVKQFLDGHGLRSNELILTGESYSGKYLPLFSHQLLVDNESSPPEDQINLKATQIIDPYPSPEIQRTSMHVVPRALGIIDQNNLNQIDALEQRCRHDHTYNMTLAADSCSFIMGYIKGVSGGVLPYNSRMFGYEWDAIEEPYVNLLTNSSRKDELYAALHVNDSWKDPIFEPGSEAVGEGYVLDNLVDYSYYYNWLMEKEFPFIVQAGEFDMQDGAASQVLWMRQLLNVSEEFWQRDRSIYYYEHEGEMNVGGYYKSEGSFTYIAVPKSGHFFPYDNYPASYAIFKDFNDNHRLTCQKKGSDCRVRDFMCAAMNNCNGNGQCGINGQCICKPGFKGADCAYSLITKDNCHDCNFNANGTEWFYFSVHENDTSAWKLEVGLEGGDEFDVFITKGGSGKSPNQFNFDAAFKSLKNFTADHGTLGTSKLVIAIRVNGFDIPHNLPNSNTIFAHFWSAADEAKKEKHEEEHERKKHHHEHKHEKKHPDLLKWLQSAIEDLNQNTFFQ